MNLADMKAQVAEIETLKKRIEFLTKIIDSQYIRFNLIYYEGNWHTVDSEEQKEFFEIINENIKDRAKDFIDSASGRIRELEGDDYLRENEPLKSMLGEMWHRGSAWGETKLPYRVPALEAILISYKEVMRKWGNIFNPDGTRKAECEHEWRAYFKNSHTRRKICIKCHDDEIVPDSMGT